MAVVIRLSRHGRKKLAFYRIVAADKQLKRDGRYLELLGTMNPLTNPITVTLKEDRVKYWVGVGAKPSQTVAAIIDSKLPGYLEGLDTARLDKIRTARKARKTRAAKGGKKEPKEKKSAKKKKS